MSRNMSILAAAIEHCRIKDAPKIYYNRNWIAEKLRVPAPVAGKWIPKDDELARFIDGLKSNATFYWLIFAMNTACRPEAALDLSPEQIDVETRLVNLNAEGRAQESTKYRPSIRPTENLMGWAEEMPTGIQDTKSVLEQESLAQLRPWKLRPRYVPYRNVDSLQSVFNRTRVRENVNLPKLVPYSIRHKMTTILRTRQVPEDQIAVLLGHRRPEFRTTLMYGEYDPSYLQDAANAIDEYLWDLNKRTDRDLFAPNCCKRQHPRTTK
jgi:integrase